MEKEQDQLRRIRRLPLAVQLATAGLDGAACLSYVARHCAADCPTAPVTSQCCSWQADFTAAAPPKKINLLGVISPEQRRDAVRFLQRQGFIVHGVWGCGGDFDDLVRAGAAAANLVVTAAGLPAAAVLQERFGQPYVAAAALNDAVTAALKLAAADGRSRYLPEEGEYGWD